MTLSDSSIIQSNLAMPPSYDQLFDYQSSSSSTVKESSSSTNSNVLKDNYPVRYAIFHAVMLGASSIVVIVLQIVLIVFNGALSEVSTGIWCGAIGLFTLIFLIYASRYFKLYLNYVFFLN